MSDENSSLVDGRQPAVSIIVPVYNVQPWLTRCLDSLTGQTLKNIEIICIDDKSTDGSLKIIYEYEKKDSRIKVIALEKNSGGASVARNAGLAVATGEYIGFVDSDDFVDFDYYERLYTRATLNGADIAKGNARILDFDEKERIFWPNLSNIRNNKFHFSRYVWSAIYKRDLIITNNIDFPVGLFAYEDIVFIRKAVTFANKVELVEDVYYRYIRRENTIDSKYFHSIKKIKSIVDGVNIVVDFINDKLADDKRSYNIVYVEELRFLFIFIDNKNNSFDGRLIAVRGAIEVYKKCKYKQDLENEFYENHLSYLSREDEVALLVSLFLENDNKITYFKLFGCIPLLKIVHRPYSVKILLFRWIPLFKINKNYEGRYYYLFFRFLVMKKETKRDSLSPVK